MSERETWATRVGFILAAVGSAVGLGNIWRFPFQAATNGGSAFLLVYLVAVVLIGLPAILAEFAIGRRAKLNAIGAFEELGRPKWKLVGALGVAGGFWTLSYYSVVGGWVIRYVVGSANGAALTAPADYFGTISAGLPAVGFHAVFMAITIGIVALGIQEGIELATKFMVPSIVVLLLALAGYAFTLPGAAGGYEFLFAFDVNTVMENFSSVVPVAVGQALFSLSLGFSVMITYASYLSKDDSLAADGISIAISNTFVGVLAGVVVLPLLFAAGITPSGSGFPSGGPGAVFVAIPTALADLPAPFGRVVSIVFFGVVLVAALSSSISLLEVVVSYLVDNYRVTRAPTAAGLGGVVFLLGVPSAIDTAWLGWFDAIAVSFLLPVSVLLVVLFVGWVLGKDAVDELRQGMSANAPLPTVWLWGLRTIVLVAVIGVVFLNLQDLFTISGPDDAIYILPPPFR
jgi:NSS family neurotransmitter:Na+ symporter